MILQQIWELEVRDITKVARRTGNTDHNCYVPLGYDSHEDAVKKPLALGYVGINDLIADDWYVGE